jgi:uncharacterized repeat protein (TIGR01451 family)
LADTFPGAIASDTYTSTTSGGASGNTASGSGILNEVLTLPVNSSVTYTVIAHIQSSATGSLGDTATVTSPPTATDPTSADNTATATVNLTPVADLSVSLTDTATGGVVPGTSLTYTITVNNTGPSDVTGATLSDTFPAAITGDTFTSTASGGATGNTASGSGNLSETLTLPAGSMVTYTVVAQISPAATGMLSNTATVTPPGTVSDPTSGDNSVTLTDPLVQTADLRATISDGASAVPGTNTTYTVVVTNNGPIAVSGATVTTALDLAIHGATYTRVLAGGATDTTPSGNGNINDSVTLPPLASITYTVTAPIDPAATGSLKSSATVAAPVGVTDPVPGNNSQQNTTPLIPTADLGITVDDMALTAVPGLSTTYKIVVTNHGPSAVTNATVTDSFPGTITAVSFTAVASGGATGFSASGTGNILDSSLVMPSTSTVTYTVVATINASATGTLSNTATAGVPAGVTDPNQTNNSKTDTDNLAPTVDLSISFDHSVTTAVPGAPLTYTLTVTNAGPSVATGALVKDVLPATITSASYTSTASGGATGNTAAGSGQILDTVNLAAGATLHYIVTANISSSATASLTTSASVTAPNTSIDTNPANNSDTETVALAPSADLRTTQTPPVITGNTLTYTVTVQNNGPSDSVGVVLTDTLPAGVSFVSATSPTTTPTFSGGLVTASFGTLAPGAMGQVIIVGTVTGTGTFTNQVATTAATPDPDPSDNTSSLPTTISASQIVLTAQPADVTAGTIENNVVVATFVDSGPAQPPSGYTATIDWGDGTAPTTGVVTLAGSTYAINGSHTYASPSRYTLTISVVRQSGGMASVMNPVTIGGLLDRFVLKANKDLAAVHVDPTTLLTEVLSLQHGSSTTLSLAKQIEGTSPARLVLISRLQRVLFRHAGGTKNLGKLLGKMTAHSSRAFVKAVYLDFLNRAPTGKEMRKAVRSLHLSASSYRRFLFNLVGSSQYLANVQRAAERLGRSFGSDALVRETSLRGAAGKELENGKEAEDGLLLQMRVTGSTNAVE